MLVLSRKPGEKIVIAGDITITVVEIRGNRVRVAIEAPRETTIVRAELFEFPVPSDVPVPDLVLPPKG